MDPKKLGFQMGIAWKICDDNSDNEITLVKNFVRERKFLPSQISFLCSLLHNTKDISTELNYGDYLQDLYTLFTTEQVASMVIVSGKRFKFKNMKIEELLAFIDKEMEWCYIAH